VFGTVRLAMRAFAVGFVTGVLVAPGSGAETRRRLSDALTRALRGILSLAALPPVEPPPALPEGEAAKPAARRRRTTGGRDAGTS
jgi:hypothetical protein